TTVRMAANLDYDTILISDATATFDRVGINGETYSAETIHLTTLANLKDEFAEILDTQALLEKL
ncbi:isochorismatase family protein, partial [Fulvivirga sp. RKSG066]